MSYEARESAKIVLESLGKALVASRNHDLKKVGRNLLNDVEKMRREDASDFECGEEAL